MAFDIDHLTRTSEQVAWGDLDLSTFSTRPLPPEVLLRHLLGDPRCWVIRGRERC